MKQQYNDIIEKKQLPAREYLQILRLAIYHHTHKLLDSSIEIENYPMNSAIWNTAIKLAKEI